MCDKIKEKTFFQNIYVKQFILPCHLSIYNYIYQDITFHEQSKGREDKMVNLTYDHLILFTIS